MPKPRGKTVVAKALEENIIGRKRTERARIGKGQPKRCTLVGVSRSDEKCTMVGEHPIAFVLTERSIRIVDKVNGSSSYSDPALVYCR